MSDTLSNIRTNVRTALDETTAKFWTDAQLNVWIGQAANNIAKRAEVLLERVEIPVQTNVAKYPAPADTVRLHRVEFTPDRGQTIYALEARRHQELDQIWGNRQGTSYAYPSFYIPWGFPPNLTMQLFPIPSAVGTLYLYYYRLPHSIVGTTTDPTVVEVPSGWEDLISFYAEYMALRKDADPRWQEAKQIYEEQLGAMIDQTRAWHDQSGWMTYGTSILPSWLVGEGW
jgi:hypothetical protein